MSAFGRQSLFGPSLHSALKSEIDLRSLQSLQAFATPLKMRNAWHTTNAMDVSVRKAKLPVGHEAGCKCPRQMTIAA